MPDAVFAIPGDLAAATGGYHYDRRVLAGLPEFGWRVYHLPLPGDFPYPSADSLAATETALAATPADAVILFDGLAFGALPASLLARVRRRMVALVHLPLAFESGLPRAQAQQFMRSEREALACAVHVVATSPAIAAVLQKDYAVPPARITVAPPGTDPASRARGASGPPVLLSVGTVSHVKGYDTLVEALASIADLEWESRIAGSLEREAETVAAVRAIIAREGLAPRIHLLGALDLASLAAEFDRARLFVLASRFESYGMAVTEALACGLPVIATRVGALATTVPADAGLLVPPDDPDSLASALRTLLSDPSHWRRYADAAWRHAQTLPRWPDTSRTIAAVLDRARGEVSA